eukprot:3749973-Prymnesium_polylepis.1
MSIFPPMGGCLSASRRAATVGTSRRPIGAGGNDGGGGAGGDIGQAAAVDQDASRSKSPLHASH